MNKKLASNLKTITAIIGILATLWGFFIAYQNLTQKNRELEYQFKIELEKEKANAERLKLESEQIKLKQKETELTKVKEESFLFELKQNKEALLQQNQIKIMELEIDQMKLNQQDIEKEKERNYEGKIAYSINNLLNNSNPTEALTFLADNMSAQFRGQILDAIKIRLMETTSLVEAQLILSKLKSINEEEYVNFLISVNRVALSSLKQSFYQKLVILNNQIENSLSKEDKLVQMIHTDIISPIINSVVTNTNTNTNYSYPKIDELISFYDDYGSLNFSSEYLCNFINQIPESTFWINKEAQKIIISDVIVNKLPINEDLHIFKIENNGIDLEEISSKILVGSYLLKISVEEIGNYLKKLQIKSDFSNQIDLSGTCLLDLFRNFYLSKELCDFIKLDGCIITYYPFDFYESKLITNSSLMLNFSSNEEIASVNGKGIPLDKQDGLFLNLIEYEQVSSSFRNEKNDKNYIPQLFFSSERYVLDILNTYSELCYEKL